MEKMVALVLLAYAIGLLVGEALRERSYRGKSRSFTQGFYPVKAKGEVAS